MGIKPVLNRVNVLTPTNIENNGYNFNFTFNGGNVGKNKLKITHLNNGSEVVDYEQTQTRTSYYHNFNTDNILAVGNQYYASLSVYTKNPSNLSEWIESNMSDKVIFKYISDPIFKITKDGSEFINNTNLQTPNVTLGIQYSQSENEALNEYQFILYNDKKVQIKNSGIKYNDTVMSFDLVGLNPDSTYFIRAIGNTVNGLSLDTGYIKFQTIYNTSSMFSSFNLKNKPLEGCIRVETTMKLIEGYLSNGEEPIYINNEKIDLTDDSSVVFEGGFTIPNAYNLHLKGNFSETGRVLSIGYNNEVEVFYMADRVELTEVTQDDVSTTSLYNGISNSPYNDSTQDVDRTLSYFLIVDNNSEYPQRVRSNYLKPKPSSNTDINIWIQRKNNNYTILAYTAS